jgi:hypothetical protein
MMEKARSQRVVHNRGILRRVKKGGAMIPSCSVWRSALSASALAVVVAHPLAAAAAGGKWATSWAAPVQGPFPMGNPSVQPKLSLAFPVAHPVVHPVVKTGVREQSFRMIIKPDIWGRQTRIPQTGGMRAESIPDNRLG